MRGVLFPSVPGGEVGEGKWSVRRPLRDKEEAIPTREGEELAPSIFGVFIRCAGGVRVGASFLSLVVILVCRPPARGV